jgi:predicted transcriptional regulator
LRENKRLIDKSIREIDRERNSLQMQEKKLIEEMKKNAKNGQMVRKERVVHEQSPYNLYRELRENLCEPLPLKCVL